MNLHQHAPSACRRRRNLWDLVTKLYHNDKAELPFVTVETVLFLYLTSLDVGSRSGQILNIEISLRAVFNFPFLPTHNAKYALTQNAGKHTSACATYILATKSCEWTWNYFRKKRMNHVLWCHYKREGAIFNFVEHLMWYINVVFHQVIFISKFMKLDIFATYTINLPLYFLLFERNITFKFAK